jgi:hypothetical protein
LLPANIVGNSKPSSEQTKTPTVHAKPHPPFF